LEIKELSREVEKANEVKEEYKIYYGKMKEEVIALREKLKLSDESVHELRREKDLLTNNCRHIEQQLAYERQMYQQNMQRGMNHFDDYREDEGADPIELGKR
jgi:vacuolar-type H+-ATPase subunit D/Vma8